MTQQALALCRTAPSDPATIDPAGRGRHGDSPDWDWIAAAPFRAHVRHVLTEEPLPWRAFAGHARVPDNVVRGLLGLGGRRLRRIAPHFARALIAIDAPSLRASLARPVPPDEMIIAARFLSRSGWPVAEVARIGHLPEPRLGALLRGEELFITHRSELLVTAAARAHGLDVTDSWAETFRDRSAAAA
ncbi:MAG TPA: hypothetical protein GXZ30_03230 [Propionibacterium sp.]|nr:hypothetical protein [Propionibacterium sp.]